MPATLEATLALVAERGFADATVADIAVRAGVSKSSIYRRWPSKERLIADAVATLRQELPEMPDSDVREALLQTVRLFVRVARDPLFGRILPQLFAEQARNTGLSHAYFEQVTLPGREHVIALLEAGMRRGELRPDLDVQVVAELLIGPAFYRLVATGGHAAFPESFAETQIAMLFDGLRPPSRGEPVG